MRTELSPHQCLKRERLSQKSLSGSSPYSHLPEAVYLPGAFLFALRVDPGAIPQQHLTACLSRPGQHTQDHVPGALRAANRHEGWSGHGVRLLRQVLHRRLPEPLQAPNRRLQRHFWYSPSSVVGKSCHRWLCSCKGNPNIRACSSGAARCKPIVLSAFLQFITQTRLINHTKDIGNFPSGIRY